MDRLCEEACTRYQVDCSWTKDSFFLKTSQESLAFIIVRKSHPKRLDKFPNVALSTEEIGFLECDVVVADSVGEMEETPINLLMAWDAKED